MHTFGLKGKNSKLWTFTSFGALEDPKESLERATWLIKFRFLVCTPVMAILNDGCKNVKQIDPE